MKINFHEDSSSQEYPRWFENTLNWLFEDMCREYDITLESAWVCFTSDRNLQMLVKLFKKKKIKVKTYDMRKIGLPSWGIDISKKNAVELQLRFNDKN